MSVFLDLFVERPEDEVAKNWVAKALLLAFPEPASEGELTHARAALAPLREEFGNRTQKVQGTTLPIHGRMESEPLLALSVVAARSGFVRNKDVEGRKQQFRALIEVVAANPRFVKSPAVRDFARALRQEIEELERNPSARGPIPLFGSIWDLIPWVGAQESRYEGYVLVRWKREIAPALRIALLNPAPPPGAAWEDESADELTADIPQPHDEESVEPALRPESHWLLSVPLGAVETKRSPELHDRVAAASLSTYAPLSKFTEPSTTWLSDDEMTVEMTRLLKDADAARAANDPLLESRLLLRALAGATSTAASRIRLLLWEGPLTPDAERTYPGGLVMDGMWLNRPELNPSRRDAPALGVVPIPIPRALAERLATLCVSHKPGEPVFPALKDDSIRVGDLDSDNRPTLTALQRALGSRLMRQEPYGPSVAQYVAGDDWGIDTAPLHYDRISAADIAAKISAITFPWFGEKPGTYGSQPTNLIGSRRIPEPNPIKEFLASIRDAHSAVRGDLAAELRQRMRNTVHGLAVLAGHRPNDQLARLRIWSFGLEDAVAILSDKVAGADWQHRPVALATRWQEEFRALLADLHRAKSLFAGQALGEAAAKALDGSGPVFLDIRSIDDVGPFELEAYQEGLPAQLVASNNFARHYLNDRLAGLLPECLRVAQMGWHGTRGGAWEDGSPWSVLSAAGVIANALHKVLKEVGWRPLGATAASMPMPRSWLLDWVAAEKEHAKRFRDAISRAKQAMAARHDEVAIRLLPKLAIYLAERHPDLRLCEAGQLQWSNSSSTEPVALSHADHNAILRFLAGGNPRSQEAHVARNVLNDLIRSARERKLVAGPIPRRLHAHWPSRPGAFLPKAPLALEQARALDLAMVRKGVPEIVQTSVALLLHGGYADVDTVLAVMRPNARISSLVNEPGVLLVEPPSVDGEKEGLRVTADWGRGCLALHGLAAMHAWSWHQRRQESAPTEEEIDRLLLNLDPELWPLAVRENQGRGALQEVAALARVCNSLRMDGWARPIGTGVVTLTATAIDRVVAARDGHLLGYRARAEDRVSLQADPVRADSRAHRTHSLLNQIYGAISKAVSSVDADSRGEEQLRDGLIMKIREWLDTGNPPRAEDLVGRFALVLLERGGRRRKRLELRTIRDYVYAVGRPLERFMPDEPLSADSDDWEAAYLSIVADDEPQARPERVRALVNFHWNLSQECDIPDVSFGEIHALAGVSANRADAGFLTDAELAALFCGLALDIGLAEAVSAPPEDAHLAKARELGAQMILSGAMRPGEVARLRFADFSSEGIHGRSHVRKTSIQRLKSVNSRRRPRLLEIAAGGTESLLTSWRYGARARLRNGYIKSMPLFHHFQSPEVRIDDNAMFARIGALARWSTADIDARTYWLRKTGIRKRLEAHMRAPQKSLWPTRDLIAEVAHGSLLVTLRSYTHDPVTPFLRWFKEGWMTITAERLALASGLSLSRVSRRQGDRGLTTRQGDVRARMEVLMAGVPAIQPSGDCTAIDLPIALGTGKGARWSLIDMSGILMRVADGDELAKAVGAFHWPPHFVGRLEGALKHLMTDYGIALAPVDEAVPGLVSIPVPRWLSDHGGIADLMELEGPSNVLMEMADCWLGSVQQGMVEGIPATISKWKEWTTAVPALSQLPWDERPHGRTLLLRSPAAAQQGRLTRWPMLRWIVLAAWVHRAVQG